CGSKKKSTGETGLKVVQAADTRAKAKKGGILPGLTKLDQPNLDPTTDGAGATSAPALGAYSRLLREKERPVDQVEIEYAGDLADSWELTADGTRLVVRLRQDAKFDPRPPTSSRPVDADDVIFTWNRFSALSPFKTTLANAANPIAPIIAIDKVDTQTIALRL